MSCRIADRARLRFARGTNGKIDEASPRSGALPPHAVWPRPQGAMHGFGGNRHSPFGIPVEWTWMVGDKRSRLRHAPKRFSLGCHSRFFWRSQKKWGDKRIAGAFAPAIVILRACALILSARRAPRGAMPPAAWPASTRSVVVRRGRPPRRSRRTAPNRSLPRPRPSRSQGR